MPQAFGFTSYINGLAKKQQMPFAFRLSSELAIGESGN
jgi:hypothetical protein